MGEALLTSESQIINAEKNDGIGKLPLVIIIIIINSYSSMDVKN